MAVDLYDPEDENNKDEQAKQERWQRDDQTKAQREEERRHWEVTHESQIYKQGDNAGDIQFPGETIRESIDAREAFWASEAGDTWSAGQDSWYQAGQPRVEDLPAQQPDNTPVIDDPAQSQAPVEASESPAPIEPERTKWDYTHATQINRGGNPGDIQFPGETLRERIDAHQEFWGSDAGQKWEQRQDEFNAVKAHEEEAAAYAPTLFGDVETATRQEALASDQLNQDTGSAIEADQPPAPTSNIASRVMLRAEEQTAEVAQHTEKKVEFPVPTESPIFAKRVAQHERAQAQSQDDDRDQQSTKREGQVL